MRSGRCSLLYCNESEERSRCHEFAAEILVGFECLVGSGRHF